MGASLKLGCIFIASRQSKRFQGNKLLSEFNGRPMIETVLGNFPCELFNQTIVVTRYAEVAVTAAQRGFTVVENDGADDSVARTIRLGLDALTPNLDGCLFSVCDQPLLTARSIQAIVDEFIAHPGAIVALGYRGKRGNPVLFPRALFSELGALAPGQSGGAVVAAHMPLLRIVETKNRLELVDIDYRADAASLRPLF